MARNRTQSAGNGQTGEVVANETADVQYVTVVAITAGGHAHQVGEDLHPDVTEAEIASMLRMGQIVDKAVAEA